MLSETIKLWNVVAYYLKEILDLDEFIFPLFSLDFANITFLKKIIFKYWG